MHPEPNSDLGPVRSTAGGSQDIEDFIYLISHDVRSSVRALIELPQWIAEDLEAAGVNIDGAVAGSIDMMNRHTGRLDRMLVDLLTFSRIGRMQDVRANDLPTVLDQVLEEIQWPAGFDLVRDLACATVTIGERDLLTLLDALLRNATKHHDRPKGRVVITTHMAGVHLVLRVADDGPGIPEKFREKVFSPMNTLRPRDEVEGSGMGLSNARKIAQTYGGSCAVKSSPYGRGCMVEVVLPVKGSIPTV